MLGELYDGEFASMEHNGRMDACMSDEISREEIAALLARESMSEEKKREEVIETLFELWRYVHTDKYMDDQIRRELKKEIEALKTEQREDAPPVHPIRPSVIEDIKSEIIQVYVDAGINDYDYASGLKRALKIIEKHTSGADMRESEEQA